MEMEDLIYGEEASESTTDLLKSMGIIYEDESGIHVVE